MYKYHNFSIHSSVNGHLGCFYVLAIVNGAAMNIGVDVSFRIMDFSGYMPSSGVAVSSGSFIPSFLKRNLHIILHSVCMDLHSPNHAKELSSVSFPDFTMCRNLMMAILTSVR